MYVSVTLETWHPPVVMGTVTCAEPRFIFSGSLKIINCYLIIIMTSSCHHVCVIIHY